MKAKVPVVYEIDENGEANGIVHPFCSESCRFEGKKTVAADAQARGFTVTDGMDGNMDTQSKCEHCGHFNYRV